MPSPTWIGATLSGRYRLESMLGQGGMSAVYLAYDPNLQRQVAVKLIHTHFAADPEFIRRFEAEAAAVAALHHPAILQVFDFNHDGDTYYMVLEYLVGTTLSTQLSTLRGADRRLPFADTLGLLSTIADAVGYAHQHGLVHRDIKPSNIMITSAGQPTLLDFGVVKIVGGTQHTATGAVVGTPAYIAPELVLGRQPDARSDIYSLGVVLFEMLAGHAPYQAGSAVSLMMMHVNEPVPDVRALNPTVPLELARVVETALAKDPTRRYQSAAQFAAAMRGLGSKNPALRTQALPAAAGGGRGPGAAGGAAAGIAGNRRSIYLLACGALLVLGLVALAAMAAIGVGYALSRQSPSATATQAASATAQAATPIPTATELAATPSAVPSPAAPLPTTAPPPTETAPPVPATPTLVPSAAPTAGKSARILSIDIVNGRYSVSFETIGYVAALPGQHVHFFFNTVSQDQAGAPGAGPWIIHAAQPNPFTGYRVSDRPPAATEMCILVANPNHSIVKDSGNCVALPQPP